MRIAQINNSLDLEDIIRISRAYNLFSVLETENYFQDFG